tara:strand:+ start:1440 stop:1673 length:234 start_codon:yes stop_codon:yes gene_type:complete
MTEKELLKIIEKALGVKNIDDKTISKDIPEWDSLGHLSILTALDEATDGKVEKIVELSESYSVKEIKQLLKKNNILN